jgi:hypothetical protein
LFGDVERVAYTTRYGEVFSAWGARLNVIRMENTPANSGKWIATQRVLQFINHKHQVQYGLAEELAGGNQSGAYLIRTPDGEEAVLKWSSAKSWLAGGASSAADHAGSCARLAYASMAGLGSHSFRVSV